MKEYRKESWIDPRIEVRESPTGKGMYAIEKIKMGEIVTIWGGKVFTNEEKAAGLVKKYSSSRIDEDHWLGASLDDPDADDMYLNHSCEPNIWLTDEVTFAARRDIELGEQITADYSTWSIDDGWVMDEPCSCGSALCRHQITGKDWMLPELQERYIGHFVPYISDRINKMGNTPLVNGQSKSLEMCKEYLGKKVSLVIDQPYGTYYKNALYEANYGYIPNTTAPDGEGLDAYFLGPKEPLKEAEGVCIAIIHRLDDDDDKLIVVEEGVEMTDEEIDRAVNFREKFFKHEIIR